ncbi:MAG: aldo/keto reductase [Pyrinomonadaceae bacterium]
MIQGYWRLGSWGMDAHAIHGFVRGHLELGITTVDHAFIYGNPEPCETMFGEALRIEAGLRDKLEIVSKCGIVRASEGKVGHYDTRPEAIIESVETSLSRLGTDRIDLLLIHRSDHLLSADGVAEAFAKLREAGKVLHFGVSNFTSAQFELLRSRMDFPLATNQVELNPLNMSVLESGLLEDLQRLRVSPMAWSCLAGGRILNDEGEQAMRVRGALEDIRNEIGADSIAQVAFAWVLRMPSKPFPIIGSGNIESVRSAAESLGFALTPEQWYRIWVASAGRSVP